MFFGLCFFPLFFCFSAIFRIDRVGTQYVAYYVFIKCYLCHESISYKIFFFFIIVNFSFLIFVFSIAYTVHTSHTHSHPLDRIAKISIYPTCNVNSVACAKYTKYRIESISSNVDSIRL